MRELILWLVIIALVAVGSFQAGYIFRDKMLDGGFETKLYNQQEKIIEVEGDLKTIKGKLRIP